MNARKNDSIVGSNDAMTKPDHSFSPKLKYDGIRMKVRTGENATLYYFAHNENTHKCHDTMTVGSHQTTPHRLQNYSAQIEAEGIQNGTLVFFLYTQ